MPLVLPMPSDSKHATYTTIRVDTEIYFRLRAAAAMEEVRTLSEYVSDKLNEVTAKVLKIPPVKRKPPPPKPHGKGRPRKDA